MKTIRLFAFLMAAAGMFFGCDPAEDTGKEDKEPDYVYDNMVNMSEDIYTFLPITSRPVVTNGQGTFTVDIRFASGGYNYLLTITVPEHSVLMEERTDFKSSVPGWTVEYKASNVSEDLFALKTYPSDEYLHHTGAGVFYGKKTTGGVIGNAGEYELQFSFTHAGRWISGNYKGLCSESN